MGSPRVGGEAEGEGKLWARVYIVVSVGKSGQGRVSRLANLNNFSSLWGTGVSLVVWYLALE